MWGLQDKLLKHGLEGRHIKNTGKRDTESDSASSEEQCFTSCIRPHMLLSLVSGYKANARYKKHRCRSINLYRR